MKIFNLFFSKRKNPGISSVSIIIIIIYLAAVLAWILLSICWQNDILGILWGQKQKVVKFPVLMHSLFVDSLKVQCQ